MAELPKLNAISRASVDRAWSDKDKNDFSTVFSGNRKPAAEIPAQEGETPEEAAVAGQQAANANSPGIQEKLNMMAKARAKFYGEGQ
jgi:hypothetical protein